ncbi:hypothetical protein Tco_0800021 [Tanacetum coccineum]|uniref:Uncharacterized protein n=1 Tax=Tanacetum coccineum TaxID=301880 RepID=A0ABQ4ZWC8_9ASTR
MASLQIENAHLKQTYKDLFESVQRSRVETNECDEVKVKVNFDEIETKNIELEHRVASLIKENEHLKLTYQSLFDSIKKSRVQTKTSNVTQNEAENLKSQLFEFAETKFNNILGKIEFFKKNQFDSFSRSNVDCHIFELKKESRENIYDNAKFVLERQLARKIDDSKAEKDRFLKEINHLRTQLENLKGKRVETKLDNSSILGKPPLLNNERDQLLKQIAFLESKLASQDIRSCQKEYHELRTSYNALKVKFDSLNRKKWNINVSKSSKPKESVSEKVHTGESSKPFSRRVSQFTTYSLQKDRKFSKKSQSFETFFPQKGFKTRASNAKNQSFETSHSCFTPVKQVWRPIKESQTFEASTSQKSFKTSTLKGKNQVFVTPHSRFTPVKQVWRPKQSHSKSFKYSKSEMLSMQNKNDSASTINKKGRFLNDAKTNFRTVLSNDNNKWKSSSSTRFKTLHETPSFNN